jgi:dTDP-L-rhamnose 4-epimerase
MPSHVLITGGAGFIGSHVADLLLERGFSVRVLDSLVSQVHGDADRPPYLADDVDLIRGDVRDRDAVSRALAGVGAVIHLAAAVGVGQSMYKIASYTEANDCGTAVLMEALLRHPVERLVCASSMSVYGEGLARRADGALVNPGERSPEQLRRGQWEPADENGEPLVPVPTPESKPPSLHSIYALNKYCQERMCLITGRAYAIPTVALRFFNVYGPRQALSNPYTGVMAIFAARLLNKRPPLVFEDGRQRRDFVHVRDVAEACLLALGAELGAGEAFNIGSGESRSVAELACDVASVMGVGEITPHVIGKFRAGDIRHCFADIAKSKAKLGFAPKVPFRTGLEDLANWLAHEIAVDNIEEATAELAQRGLVA